MTCGFRVERLRNSSCGGVLCGYHRFLRWRFMPPATPARGGPALGQLNRHVGPGKMGLHGGVAMKDLVAGADEEIGRVGLLEFRLPPRLKLSLLRLGECAGTPERRALHVVRRTDAIPLEFVKTGRPATVAAPQPHHDGAAR